MRLLINGSSARLGGGQTYLYQLLRYFPSDWKIILISSGKLLDAQIPKHIRHIILPQLTNPFRRIIWERRHLEKFATEQDCQLIFNPACLLPPVTSNTIKTAVTFQNMLPFDARQRRSYQLLSYRRLRDMLLERGLLNAMKRSDLVIFISQFARQFILQHKLVKPHQSVVIPHGIDARFFTPAALPDGLTLQPRNYFLYVSFLDYYKCQRETLHAYAALKAQRTVTEKLVFAGSGYPRYEALLKHEIAALNLVDDVILLGNIPHESLPALYQNAKINLFASTCENCPNILMEIMASGTASLVSNHGPMPELAGDTVQYFNPLDPIDFVTCWNMLLQNQDVAASSALRARARAQDWHWQTVVERTAQALESLIARP